MKKVFFAGIGIACAILSVNAEELVGAPKTQARAELIWTKVLCKEPGRYIGWPTVCVQKNGELIAIFSGDRDQHVCPFGKSQCVRSTDGGATWSAPVTVCNTPLDDRDSGIITLRNGDLIMSWFTSLAFEGSIRDRSKLKPDSPRFYWWLHDEKLTAETKKEWLGSFTRRSTNGGKTWEAPVRVPCSTPHGPIQLKDGRLLYVGKSSDADHVNFGKDAGRVLAVESTDQGRTWKEIGVIPFETNVDILHWCHEPHVVETADGRLVAQIRYEPHGKVFDNFLRQSESSDGGKTWTLAAKTALDGLPPHLIRLADGKILSVYGRRWKAFGEYACLSDDQGRTWDVSNEIKLCGHWCGDLGYPASTQLADGTILTVYYQADKQDEKTCLMGTLWKVTK